MIGVRGWSPNVVFFSWVRCRGGLSACPRFYVRPSVPRLGAPPGVTTPGAITRWIPKNEIIKKSLKMNVWCDRKGSSWRHPNWTMKTRKAFPCSTALVPFFAGAFPCSVALAF